MIRSRTILVSVLGCVYAVIRLRKLTLVHTPVVSNDDDSISDTTHADLTLVSSIASSVDAETVDSDAASATQNTPVMEIPSKIN